MVTNTKNTADVGQIAPNFSLLDQNRQQVTLADYRGQNVVLFFYPKDHSPVCTAEACAFRDSYEAFCEAGAVVIGISADSPETHQSFVKRNRLPYALLSDSDSSVHQLYGAKTMFGLMNNRVTFVIDREGIIRHRYADMMNGAIHITETLKILKDL